MDVRRLVAKWVGGLVGFLVASALVIVGTIVAASMDPDPSMQGAYSFSLFLTIPPGGLLGSGLGWYLGGKIYDRF